MQSRMNAKISFLLVFLELNIIYFDHVHWPPSTPPRWTFSL